MYNNIGIIGLRLIAVYFLADIISNYSLIFLPLQNEHVEQKFMIFLLLGVALKITLVIGLWFGAPFLAKNIASGMSEKEDVFPELAVNQLNAAIFAAAGVFVIAEGIKLAVQLIERIFQGVDIAVSSAVVTGFQIVLGLFLIFKPKKLLRIILDTKGI